MIDMNKDVHLLQATLRCVSAALLALSLAGCQSQSIRTLPSDLGESRQPRMQLVDAVASMRAVCRPREQGRTGVQERSGCLPRAPDGPCWIVTVRRMPLDGHSPLAIVGDEFLHCRGRRHS